jgi:energy-coupling factor transporter ATP-binding protein EcfA2
MKNNQKQNHSSNIINDVVEEIAEGLRYILINLPRWTLIFIRWLWNRNSASQSTRNNVRLHHLKKKGRKITNPDLLGFSENWKKEINMKNIDWKRHTMITGGSGLGKSTLFKVIAEYNIRENNPFVVIDPKGHLEELQSFRQICSHYNKKLYIFCENYRGEEAVNLNPLRELDDTRIVALIMNSFFSESTVPYFKDRAKVFLLNTLKKISTKRQLPSFHLIYKYIEEDYGSEKDASGLISTLKILCESTLGRNLKDDGHIQAKNMEDIIREGACLYISISTQGFGEFAKSLGKLFTNELLQLSAKRNGNYLKPLEDFKPFVVFIDETGSVIEPEYLDLINKCRSAGIQIVSAVQSPNDFENVSRKGSMLTSLTECYSNFFFFRQSDPETAEFISRLLGTTETIKKTRQTNDDIDTGGGSVREVNEFAVGPDVIKELTTAQAVMVNLGARKEIHLMTVRNPESSPAYKKLIDKPKIEIYKRDYQREKVKEAKTEEIGSIRKSYKKVDLNKLKTQESSYES